MPNYVTQYFTFGTFINLHYLHGCRVLQEIMNADLTHVSTGFPPVEPLELGRPSPIRHWFLDKKRMKIKTNTTWYLVGTSRKWCQVQLAHQANACSLALLVERSEQCPCMRTGRQGKLALERWGISPFPQASPNEQEQREEDGLQDFVGSHSLKTQRCLLHF